jgi:hypothetical protein
MRFSIRWYVCGVGLAAIGLMLSGCEGVVGRDEQSRDRGEPPTVEEVERMLEPNVLGVSCIYEPFNPWIRNEDRSEVRGIVIGGLYLEGPKVKGVFGDGIIRPKLFVAYRDENGKKQWKLAKKWSFDVEEAMPFRAKKEKLYGWGYSLFLNWGDLNLAGREIRMTVDFERRDGRIVRSGKKDFRVPRKGGY